VGTALWQPPAPTATEPFPDFGGEESKSIFPIIFDHSIMRTTFTLAATLVSTTTASSIRGGLFGQVAANEGCNSLTLCSTCESHTDAESGGHDCVWCADKGGFCTAGSPETGPADAGVCAADAWTNGYCLKEDRCGFYSACHSCLADPFCGWCPNGGLGGKGVCVEGETKSPLTGSCPAWEYGKCSEEPLDAANPSTDDVEKDAADAMGQIEGVAKDMSNEKKETEGDEKNLLSAEKKAFNVIRGIKHIIQGYKTRKEHDMTATSHFTGSFERKLGEVMQKRRNALDKVKDLLKDEYKEEIEEAGIVKLQMGNEGKANEEGVRLVNGVDISKFKEGAEVDKITGHLYNEEKSMQGLEHFLGSLTARDHVLMQDLKKHAHTNIEQELHTATMRKMQREEAAWYSCSFLIQNSNNDEHPCPKFSAKYVGEQKEGRDGELTPEENTRVCNQVETKMKALTETGTALPKPGLSADVYLSWCVNHVNIVQAKQHQAAAETMTAEQAMKKAEASASAEQALA
jgi:hypothetical protein